MKIYWGGADTVMCVGEANISDLVALAWSTEDRRSDRSRKEAGTGGEQLSYSPITRLLGRDSTLRTIESAAFASTSMSLLSINAF